MADKMKLYWCPMGRSIRIIWMIKEMGVESDFELIKYPIPNPDPEAVKAYRRDVHPHATIPALVVPGKPTILESGAICMYLADRYSKLAPPSQERNEYYDYIIYANSTIDELMDFFFNLLYFNVQYPEKDVDTKTTKFDVCMEVLAKRLGDRKWICGNEITTPDFVVGYDLYLSNMLGEGKLLKKHPKIREYYSRMEALDSFKATIAMQ